MATIRSPALHVRHPADLHAILNPDCALAIWRRQPCPVLSDMLARLDVETVDDLDDEMSSDYAALNAAVMLSTAGYGCSLALVLARAIGALADRLSSIAGCARVRLRLEVVETDACRRFHADMVTLRLIVTLRGPGTQWIAADAPDVIEQVPTGAVAIFKGRLLEPEPRVLHRSPPLTGTAERRLVLVIDPIAERTDATHSPAGPYLEATRAP